MELNIFSCIVSFKDKNPLTARHLQIYQLASTKIMLHNKWSPHFSSCQYIYLFFLLKDLQSAWLQAAELASFGGPAWRRRLLDDKGIAMPLTSARIMFGNSPLAKANYMGRSGVKGWRSKSTAGVWMSNTATDKISRKNLFWESEPLIPLLKEIQLLQKDLHLWVSRQSSSLNDTRVYILNDSDNLNGNFSPNIYSTKKFRVICLRSHIWASVEPQFEARLATDIVGSDPL